MAKHGEKLIHLKYKADEKYHMGSAVTRYNKRQGAANVRRRVASKHRQWRFLAGLAPANVKTVEGDHGSSTHGSGPGIVNVWKTQGPDRLAGTYYRVL